jgi:predicted CXXCH cytochrome family protein
MPDKRLIGHGVIACLVTLIVAAAASGCSQVTRHDVLTFFFTGVPEPGDEAAREKLVGETRPDVSAAVARKKKLRELRFQQQTRFFMHGPYGAGQCEHCHATTASKPFRTVKAVASDTAAASTPSIGPRLAFPLEELCITCHSEKSPAAAKTNGLWQHEPASKGRCTLCHSPHKSERQYMLHKANNVELCTQCHAPKDLQLTVEHNEDPAADCISCHNPHVGVSSSLLRAEYDEWQGFNAP